MEKLIHTFHEGGWGMYPILVLGIMGLFIAGERIWALYFRMGLDKEHFFKNITSSLLRGDLEGMISVCDMNPAPMSKVIKTCMIRLLNNGTDEDVQAALDEGALVQIPQIERRTGFLAMIGNVATLCGLLGTISGLIACFAGVANADPATKAQVLTAGISEAMNCTAFGLVVAIPAVVAYSFLNARATGLVEDINEISIRTLNFIIANRERFGVQNNKAA